MMSVPSRILPIVLLIGGLFTMMSVLWGVYASSGGQGSLTVFLLILGVSTLFWTLFLLLTPERRSLAFAIIQGKRSSKDYNVDVREDFWPEIERAIAQAKAEVVFLGGISQHVLDMRWQQLFAERLLAVPNIRITLIYESEDNLFRRSQYTEQPMDRHRDYRDFSGMLKRKAMIENFGKEILDRLPEEYRQQAAPRIDVREIHLQLLLTITKVDHVLFVSLITHRRNSASVAMRLEDRDDPLYVLADEYLKYLRDEGLGGPYCTPHGEEVLPIYDPMGFHRGYAARSTFTRRPIITRVVFGLVLDDKEQILLQRRGEGAYDNRGLWDKSFGGRMRAVFDHSTVETAIREFQEELLQETHTRTIPAYFGHWQDTDYMVDIFSRRREWFFLQLSTLSQWRSQRVMPSGDVVNLHFIVDLYAFFCPGAVADAGNTNNVAQTRWVPLNSLKDEVIRFSDDFTSDLRTLVGMDEEMNKVRTFARAVRH